MTQSANTSVVTMNANAPLATVCTITINRMEGWTL